jgi:hypothetical protein
MDHEQWLMVASFTTVCPCAGVVCIPDDVALLAPTLKEHTGESTVDVLLMLYDLFLEKLKPSESLPKTIEPFVAARKLAGHSVAIHRREEQGWMTVF